MILIADSGSTKTSWCLSENKEIKQLVETKGTNPFFQTEKDIIEEIENSLLTIIDGSQIDKIFFYGAGCAFPDKIEMIKSILSNLFHLHHEDIEVYSDMVGAARALCGHQSGIACILGTGSNSCLYDGEQIVQNVSPLGFILGDEGSGAVLGKLLIGDLLKGQIDDNLKSLFLETYHLTPSDIIEAVYKKPFPNRFLASFSPFWLEHINHPMVHQRVFHAFRDFLRRNVVKYDRPDLTINFVGSVAYYYQSILEEAVAAENMKLGRIIKNPIEGLIEYHQ